jgi:hypothetical protein
MSASDDRTDSVAPWADHARRIPRGRPLGCAQPADVVCSDAGKGIELSLHFPRRTFNVLIARERGRHLRVDVSRRRSGRAVPGPRT